MCRRVGNGPGVPPLTPTIAGVRFCTLLGAAGLLSACGSGGAALAPAPVRATQAPGTSQSVRFSLTIAGPPGTHSSAKRRLPRFVSPATDGVLIAAYAHTDPQHVTLLGSTTADVSSGSAACGGQTGYPRTCAVAAPAPVGDDDFVVTTYDAAPSGGAFGPTAHVLGRGAVNETVVSGAANTASVFISGVVSSLNPARAFASLPADGMTHSFAFVLQPQDFDNDPITAGTNDPYANPITLTLAETGGSGHATMVLNGTAVGTSATITHSSDTIALRYDGQGGSYPPYTTLTTISAPGVTATSVRVSPMYISELDADYVPSNSGTNPPAPVVLLGQGDKAYLFVYEADAPLGTVYSATPSSGCSGVVSVSMSGTTALLIDGSTAAANGVCTITMSDGMSSVPVTFTNGVAGPDAAGPLTVTTYWPPSFRTTDFTAVTRGPDGAMWFWVDSVPAYLTRVATSGALTQFAAPTFGNGYGSRGYGIAAGADGNLWVTDSSGSIDRVTTAGVWTVYRLPSSSSALSITAGGDGNLWFTESQVSRIGRITPAGTITEFPLPAGYSVTNPWTHTITKGPDGNVWFTVSPDAVGRIASDGTVTMFPQPAGSAPDDITGGPDGNVWFSTSAGISKITPSGSVTSFPLPDLAYGCLTAGADGNLWVVVNAQLLAKVTVNGAVTEYAVPNVVQRSAIATGFDADLWIASEPAIVRVQY